MEKYNKSAGKVPRKYLESTMKVVEKLTRLSRKVTRKFQEKKKLYQETCGKVQ